MFQREGAQRCEWREKGFIQQRAEAKFARLKTVFAALAALGFGGIDVAQAADEEAQPLAPVTVTGSRLRKVQAEGASSVTVIKGEDIERQGYKNVFDALSHLTQNTGFTQGEDFGNTFTPAANAISLRGLGPNHTLTLINGRRLAEYPTAYEGQVNFVNLSNIPSALIDRIEVLNAGASAIYGSDAIAGVVNIILKKSLTGLHANVKAGSTQQGGGESLRLQLSGGGQAERLQAVWGVELNKRQPIWSRQRDFMADTTLQGAAPSVVAGRRDATTNTYLSPDAGRCEALGGLFEGSTKRYQNGKADYCASGRASPDYWTTQTGNEAGNFAGLLKYQLDEKTELFSDLLFGLARTANNTRGPSWTSLGASSGYFRNANTGELETWSRRLAPEELGGVDRLNREWRDTTASLAFGMRGELPGAWDYELAYSASGYRNKARSTRLLASIDEFFLGPQQGLDSDDIPIYAADPARLYTALTPAEFDRLSTLSESNNRSWTHSLSFTTHGELAQLPAGPLQAAVTVEAGSQGYSNRADPRLGQGLFYNTQAAFDAGGTRQRYAFGTELNAPLTRQLTATLAGRQDAYRFAGRRDSKFTYQGGLEFRPTPDLLLRANHGTSFRAPDINYIYSALSRGYYASSTDYYRCAQANQPLATCEYAGLSPGFNYTTTGSKDLKSENGRSSGAGLVWSPSKRFDVSIDFWKIEIKDLVTSLSSDQILRDEADCRTGAKDINTPSCIDAIRRVQRNPDNAVIRPGEVNQLLINPINAAQESTRGFDIGVNYQWKLDAIGDFQLAVKYTRVQSYILRQSDGDPSTNIVGTRDMTDWPSKLNANLAWNRNDWSASLTGERSGKLPDADTGWIQPQWLFNSSAGFRFDKNSQITLIVNNLANKTVRDNSGGWPFYPVGNYSPHGRQAWIEFDYQFGG